MATNDDRLFSRNVRSFYALIRETVLMGYTVDLRRRLKENTLFKEITKFNTLFAGSIRKAGQKGYSYRFGQDGGFLRRLAIIFFLSAMTAGECASFLGILRTLGEEPMPIGRLEQRMGVAVPRNTLRKHLRELEHHGLVAGRKGGYVLSPDLLEGLSPEERRDLRRGVSMALHMEHLTADLHTALLVMEIGDGEEEDPLPIRYEHTLFHPLTDELHLQPLLEAMEEGGWVAVDYYRPREEQTVSHTAAPLDILYDVQHGRGYLYAWCPGEGMVLVLRLDRILRAERVEGGVPVPDDALAAYRERRTRCWNVTLGEECHRVELLFRDTGPNRYRLENERRGGSVEEADGGLLYRVEITDLLEIKPWVLSFGSGCRVLGPPALRKEIMETLGRMAHA